jgi:hypothetical protein
LPRDQDAMPREIGARFGQPQQEGQNHFAADRYVRASPGCCRLRATAQDSVLQDSVGGNSADRNEAQSET